MEDNQNKGNHPRDLGSEDTSIDLKANLPDWLLSFIRPPMVCLSDQDENMLEGYPNDDDY